MEHFHFPDTNKRISCNITKIVEENDPDYIPLKSETRLQMAAWQEFMDLTIEHGQKIPRFPIWAMEFGADYEFKKKAPAFQSVEELRGNHGHLGKIIKGETKLECLQCLPIYAQTDRSEVFPEWKIRYIEQNREFYKRNKKWLDSWIAKVRNYENSHLKLEWNCGDDAEPTLFDKIIQFRASGIRVKLPTFSPALNLVGTQIPILPWVKLPKETLKANETDHGRYLTRWEAAKLQGMMKLKFGDDNFSLSTTRSFEALGNAVNVTVVKHIAKNLIV